MGLTDAQLRRLVASDPSDTVAREMLRDRVRWDLIRRLPNPTGTCPHGKRIVWDQRGAFSSGYPLHLVDGEDRTAEPGYCDEFAGIVNDPPSPERARMLALIESL